MGCNYNVLKYFFSCFVLLNLKIQPPNTRKIQVKTWVTLFSNLGNERNPLVGGAILFDGYLIKTN